MLTNSMLTFLARLRTIVRSEVTKNVLINDNSTIFELISTFFLNNSRRPNRVFFLKSEEKILKMNKYEKLSSLVLV